MKQWSVLAIGLAVSASLSVPVSGAAAAGDQPRVEQRPAGALSGKIVYLNAGHGWTAANQSGGAWTTQRGESFEIVEDLLNGDFHAFQAESLWNAGATIVPLRPIGDQIHEVVLDNDDPGVTFEGPWSDSSSPVYFGSAGDLPYRFAAVSETETARAVYRPVLPEAGLYPVYTWVLGDANRADQLYRVEHAGGVTEVRVDHRRVGGGLVYLGTYRFEAGDSGSVTISNRVDGADAGAFGPSGVVIADMIRFGNGMGDIDRGGGVSGYPRADEASLYWIETHAGQGVPSSAWRTSSNDGSSTVGTPPRWAARMNRAGAGDPEDRVFLSHHSNAANTVARGVIALYNGNNNPASATPNQFLLADVLASRINTDLPARDAGFEHPWGVRSVVTLDRSDFEFGEISNLQLNNEMDATIVERAFHDNQFDAELLRDTAVNRAMADATTRGLIEYFGIVDGGATIQTVPPAPVTHASAVPIGATDVRLDWCAAGGSAWNPDPADRVVVQHSFDGSGFIDLLTVPAAGPAEIDTDALGLTASGQSSGVQYFRLVAENDGGRSVPSTVLAASPGGPADVLIVDGFDREDRFLNTREFVGFGTIDRVRPARQNAKRYAVPVASSIAAAGLRVATASNEAVVASSVDLDAFPAGFWLLGEESAGTDTFDGIEQFIVSGYVAGGGSLLVSGSEVAWDLGFLNAGGFFLENTLGVTYAADDAGTYAVRGEPGSAFEGVGGSGAGFAFDDGSVWYDAEFPDVFGVPEGSSVVLRYAGAFGGPAGVAREHVSGARTLTLGFPIETVVPEADRDAAVEASLRVLGLIAGPCTADLAEPFGVLDLADVGAFVAGFTGQTADGDLDGNGVWDLADIGLFVGSFTAGCP
jgi:hypothetical protein